jgi:hypothetical protein
MLPRECTTVRGRCAREQDLIQVDEDPVCDVASHEEGGQIEVWDLGGVFGYSMGEGRKMRGKEAHRRDREMNEHDVHEHEQRVQAKNWTGQERAVESLGHAGEMLIGDLVRRMATQEKLLRKGWGDGDAGESEAQHLIRRCAPCRQSVNFQFSDTEHRY